MKKFQITFILVVIIFLLPISALSAEIIGVWNGKNVSGNFLYDQITIEKDAMSYKMIRILKDGHSMVNSIKKMGNKYIDPNEEDYYVISSSGMLEICDSQGVVFIFPKK